MTIERIAMKLSIPKVVLILAAILIASNLSAEVVTEATVGGGYQSNLFNDSNSTGDKYASIGMGMKYYPSGSTQLAAGAQYSTFTNYGDLSNLTGDLSVTIIATPETSPFTLALTGSMAARKFGTLYKLYDQVGGMAGANFSYRITRWAYLQSSVSYLNNNYTNSDFGSNRGVDIATGVNLTVLGSNSIALKMDYSRRSFDQPTLIQTGSNNSSTKSQSTAEIFDITGVLLRYSRPLGERTGLNLSIGHRQLHVDNDYTVLGYTIDYLSPWTNLWEGMNYSGGLKHIFPKQITAELSCAYFDKSFIDVIELGEVTSETYWRDTRDDQLTTLSFSISKAVSLQNGKQLTPSIYFGYRKNQSSTGFFNYEDLSASISLKIGL